MEEVEEEKQGRKERQEGVGKDYQKINPQLGNGWRKKKETMRELEEQKVI